MRKQNFEVGVFKRHFYALLRDTAGAANERFVYAQCRILSLLYLFRSTLHRISSGVADSLR